MKKTNLLSGLLVTEINIKINADVKTNVKIGGGGGDT
jgi:hypothetical protein